MSPQPSAAVISRKNAEHYSWGDGCDGWHLTKLPSASVIEEGIPPHKGEVRHFHKNADQFFYVLSGVATIEAGGTSTVVSKGEGINIPRGVPHQFRNDSDAKVQFLVFSVPPSHGDRVDV